MLTALTVMGTVPPDWVDDRIYMHFRTCFAIVLITRTSHFLRYLSSLLSFLWARAALSNIASLDCFRLVITSVVPFGDGVGLSHFTMFAAMVSESMAWPFYP